MTLYFCRNHPNRSTHHTLTVNDLVYIRRREYNDGDYYRVAIHSRSNDHVIEVAGELKACARVYVSEGGIGDLLITGIRDSRRRREEQRHSFYVEVNVLEGMLVG